MSADLMPFDYEGQTVRTVTIDGEPWFVAVDAGVILGYSEASAMTRTLDDDEKGLHNLQTPGGDQRVLVISEPGLFSAIMRSRVPGAREFKRWVTHTVLPQIRKTGRYGQIQLPSKRELAVMLIEAEDAREAAETRAVELSGQVAQLAPAASAWEELAAAEGDYDTRAAAQILCRAGIETGQNRLRSALQQLQWIGRDRRPYQRHVDAGRLAERVTSWTDPQTGDERVSYQLRITPKGLGELRTLLGAPKLAVLPGGAS